MSRAITSLRARGHDEFARRLIDRSGLVPKLLPIAADTGETPGRVVAQEPGASEPAEVGRVVKIYWAKKVLHVTVPKVLGKSEAQARSALCVAGLKPVVEHSAVTGTRGAVVLQSPPALADAPRGSEVTLEVVAGGSKVAVDLQTGCPP